MNTWWTPEEVAAHYRMPVQTVRRKIRRGEIRAKNRGTEKCRRYLISLSEIRRLDAA